MSTKFKTFSRKDEVAYPQIYARFKTFIDDVEEEFLIQDLTEEYFDAAIDFSFEYHGRGAVFQRAANTMGSEEGLQQVRNNYRKIYEQKISLICIKADTKEIAGLNALYLKSKYDEAKPSEIVSFQLLNEFYSFIRDSFDLFSHYNVDMIMTASGLCVDKKFRGRGIATEILKARRFILKSIGVQVTTSVFSTLGGQRAALAAGYDENYSISFEELKQIFPKMNFSHSDATDCKVLSLKVD
jgi:GNAT superfamily N-acetyltransferase